MPDPQIRIIYFGTPDFAVAALEALVHDGFNVVAVVTAPDKPSGRGLKLQQSPVKVKALALNFPVLQPESMKDELFLKELSSFSPDIQVVVAFRKLPAAVWQLPKLGTFNLHASLLPQYRGAAPINWAVINGESQTGLTTFFLDDKIDTGKIILQEVMPIESHDDAGQLHDRMMTAGAKLVSKTVNLIVTKQVALTDQASLEPGNVLHNAPKLNKENCRIAWDHPATAIRNFIRGLCPYPGAIAELNTGTEVVYLKIFKTSLISSEMMLQAGEIATDNKSFIRVGTGAGFLEILELQVAGRKRMPVVDFLRGTKLEPGLKFVS
ncbi:MAG: methionyl-tRNA formyltransferase [Bacteroidota bacterium]